MRVAIVTESFRPTLNGVTTTVCRVLAELADRGHTALVIAPGPAPARYRGATVVTVPSIPVREFPTGVPTPALRAALHDFAPDVLHAASPFVLGARALRLADDARLPTVAVFQTDMPNYLAQHGPSPIQPSLIRATWRWLKRIHGRADLTLAPSSSAVADLAAHAIPRVRLWGRGIDTELHHPGWRDDPAALRLRRDLAPGGEVLLGYVGRLAPEKELHRLVEVARLPGTRLVVVGDGPDRSRSRSLLTAAAAQAPGRGNPPPAFLGRRSGEDLARAYAAFDVFVHTGTRETFGQTLQEAAAHALPVLAPARGGPLDLIADGCTGLLFDPDRAGSLQEQAIRLADDPGLRERLGAAAHERVRDKSWSRLVERLTEHYLDAQSIRDRRETGGRTCASR